MNKVWFIILLFVALTVGLIAQEMAVTAAPANGYFGVYLSDLDEDSANELAYPYQFGVLITGVVDGSPAQRQGLLADDIVMSVNGIQANDRATFMQLTANVFAGDTVNFVLWRSGAPVTMSLVAGERPATTTTIEMPATRTASVGFGGGSWIPSYQFQDSDDINALLNGLGFSNLPDPGFVMQGGAGKGNVGKGIFIGGQGMAYSVERKRADTDPAFAGYQTSMRFTTSMGGVTIDKRIPLIKNFVGSFGLMLGAGEHNLELSHSNGSYNWNDVPGTMINTANSYVRLRRDFMVVQPRAEVLWKILPWFAFRAEVGYTYGYAPEEGWKVVNGNGDTFEVGNSPNTPFGGLSISAGPWFGF